MKKMVSIPRPILTTGRIISVSSSIDGFRRIVKPVAPGSSITLQAERALPVLMPPLKCEHNQNA